MKRERAFNAADYFAAMMGISICAVISIMAFSCGTPKNRNPELKGQYSNAMKDTTNGSSIMHNVESKDGTTIGYWESGSGPPLLLVHGTTADHHRWSKISPKLEEHFTVYVMDRRGRGGSADSRDYELLKEAEDIAAVIRSIGEPSSVLGHSYGAVCALEAALLTDKIDRLILYEPPIPTNIPMYPANVPDRMQALIEEGHLEAALELFFHEVVRMPEEEFKVYRNLPMWKVRIKLTPTIPRELAIDRLYQFHAEKFSDLKIPVLILLGGDSPAIFQRAAHKADSALSDCEIQIMAGQQHIAMDTNPGLFLEKVLNFLQE